jgi:DNA-binding response OmpR family regulator
MEKKAKRILIADDEHALSKALSLKFTHEGFETVVVGNGEEALAEIKKGGVDAVVLDLVMPKVDGFKVLQTLQEEKNTVPVVVTSNLSQEEDVKRVKDMGAKEFFIKSDTSLADIVSYVGKLA